MRIIIFALSFFFLLGTISHQIISNYKETQQTRPRFFIPAKNTFEFFHSSKKQSLLLLLPLDLRISRGPPCIYKREKENGFCPWTGRGRVIVRIFRQVCVARGLCVEKILTVGAVLFAPSWRNVKEAISTRRKSSSVSPTSPYLGPALTLWQWIVFSS